MTAQLDFERARFNMVEQQVRTWEVLDQRVLDVLSAAPRERYTPEPYRRLAYADMEIPLAEGQCMMSPRVEARLLQALALQPGERVRVLLSFDAFRGLFLYHCHNLVHEDMGMMRNFLVA